MYHPGAPRPLPPPPRVPPSTYAGWKDGGVAAVFSIIPGLGQVYNGQIGKGIFFLLLGIIFAASIPVLVGLVLFPLFWIYNINDAYSTAKKINAGLIRT